jgi:hypothetical protein
MMNRSLLSAGASLHFLFENSNLYIGPTVSTECRELALSSKTKLSTSFHSLISSGGVPLRVLPSELEKELWGYSEAKVKIVPAADSLVIGLTELWGWFLL